MKNTKVEQLVTDVNNYVSQYTIDQVKKTIGDSTNNNRQLSFSQVVRFLRVTNRGLLASKLQRVFNYYAVRNLLGNLRHGTFRTDAYEWREFMIVVDNVTWNTTWMRSLSQLIRTAA